MLRAGAAVLTTAEGVFGGTGAVDGLAESPRAATKSFWEPLDRQMIDGLQVRPSDHVLDAGCGRGDHLVLLGAAASQGSVAGLDINPDALAAAGTRVREARQTGRVRLHQADLLKPPFAEGGLDLIWASHVLHILADPVAAVRTLKRLLKPGGRIAVREDRHMTKLLPYDFGVGTPGLEYRIELLSVNRFVADRMRRGPVPFGWARVLVEAGFREVKAKSFLFELQPPFTDAQELHLRDHLRRHLELGRTLCPEDRQTLERITDPRSEHYVLRRPDLLFTSVATVYLGTSPS